MELQILLFYGSVVGVGAGTLAAILGPLFVRGDAVPAWRAMSTSTELIAVFIHMLAGAGLALLFWLSWGLAALIDVNWWQRGVSFALLAFAALCGPLLLLQWLHTRVSGRVLLKSATDALLTCVLVGLICAWSWNNGR